MAGASPRVGEDPFAAPVSQQRPQPGDSPFAAIKNAADRVGDAARGAAHAVHGGVLFARDHPVDAALDVMGGLQRGVGETLRQSQRQAAGQSYSLSAIGDSIMHPSDEVNARTTEGVRATVDQIVQKNTFGLIHVPTHEGIRKFVNGIPGLTQSEKDWMGTIAGTGEDITLQAISDPLTLADGLGTIARVAGVAIRGSRTLRAMHAAVPDAIKPAFDHLLNTSGKFTQGEAITQRAARAVRNKFIRPDLDKIFTADGKRMRLSVENKWYGRATTDIPDLKSVVDDPTAAENAYLLLKHRAGSNEEQRLIEQHFRFDAAGGRPSFVGDRFDVGAVAAAERAKFVARGVVPSAQQVADRVSIRRTQFMNGRLRSLRSELSSFSASSSEEKLADLYKARDAYRDGGISAETKALAQRDPSILQSGNPALTDFDKLQTEAKSFKLDPNSAFGKVASFTSGLAKQAVSAVPWIHELRNVGELAHGGGGLHMVPAMMYQVVKHGGASADDLARLDRIGALPTFFHDSNAAITRIWVIKQMQEMTQKMDIGYRAALLKTLDKIEGDSAEGARMAVEREFKGAGQAVNTPEFTRAVQTRTYQNEMLKGRSISERIGDPRNQDNIVRMFQAFGGWYPAFRLGIVPRNVAATFLEHPGRTMNSLRVQPDFNANRKGKDKSEYVLGGPTLDASEFGASVAGIPFSLSPKYLTSPATSGIVGSMIQGAGGDVGERPDQTALRFGAPLVPYSGTARDLYQAVTGQSVDEPAELRDRFLYHFFNFATGFYEKHLPNAKVQKMTDRRLDKEYAQ